MNKSLQMFSWHFVPIRIDRNISDRQMLAKKRPISSQNHCEEQNEGEEQKDQDNSKEYESRRRHISDLVWMTDQKDKLFIRLRKRLEY